MSEKMHAAVIHEYGGNEVVRIEQVDVPGVGEGELLVKTLAAGVNPIDWKIRDGAGKRLGMELPIRLGGELVGSVQAVGGGVEGFEVGQTVFGMGVSSAFAEYAAVKAAHMVTTPSNLDAVQAAVLPLAGSTAWQALFDEAELGAGQRVLITAASGGVGLLATQFAKARGARVTAMASTRNEELVRGLGVDEFIDYTKQPFEDVAHDMDVVLDLVGGDTFKRAFATLKKGGRMVTVVAFPGDEAERYGVKVTRTFTKPSAANLTQIKKLVEGGQVVPHVDKVVPLSELKEALSYSESGRARGKIVITFGG